MPTQYPEDELQTMDPQGLGIISCPRTLKWYPEFRKESHSRAVSNMRSGKDIPCAYQMRRNAQMWGLTTELDLSHI